jgi:hypothetical protein
MKRLLPCFLLVACGPFQPVPGSWELLAVSTVSDDCLKSDGTSIIDPALPGDTFTLTNTGEGTFRTSLLLDQGEVITSDCTLDADRAYTCLPNATSLELVPDGVMTITQVDGGSFDAPDVKHGGSTIDVTCEGDGCPDLEEIFDVDLPCQAVLAGEAEPVEP